MKTIDTSLGSVLATLVAVAALSTAQGESNGILANAGDFRPKITVSDSYTEQLAVETRGGVTSPKGVTVREKVAITVVANVEGIDPSQVDPELCVSLQIGNFSIFKMLRDDPAYTMGKTQAAFPVLGSVFDAAGNPVDKVLGRLSCVWNDHRLAVTFTCTDIDTARLSGICARDYAGAAARGTSLSIAPEPIEVSLSFGDFTGSRTAYLKGVTRTQTRRFGASGNRGYSEIDLASVALLGTADTTSPRVNAAFPATSTASGQIAVGGLLSDDHAVCIPSVTVNGVEATAPVITIDTPASNGACPWRVENIQLQPGVNDVRIQLCDADGNASIISKRQWVNAPR